MNKFKFYFILLIATVALFSCSKDDTVENVPPRDYAVQYPTDIADIEEYLNTYYLDMDLADPNFADKDVVITKIPVGGTQPKLMSYLNANTFPKLLYREVSLHGIKYVLYYLVLREGVGGEPCNVDGVFASYRGDYLQRSTATGSVSEVTATKFEEVKNPQSFFDLPNTIRGWGETFPEFKTGTYISNPDGTITYKDFGAGVMFIPSGLAYYNLPSGSIPIYAPLVFSFKLYEIQRLDQDADGIPSYQEDIDGDGYVRYLETGILNLDDTDKDGIPDFLDSDDDGDNYTTKLELKKPDGTYHTFETVPSCSGQTAKRYLTTSCKPPYID